MTETEAWSPKIVNFKGARQRYSWLNARILGRVISRSFMGEVDSFFFSRVATRLFGRSDVSWTMLMSS
ncbi:hypothetical protein [uncultured Nitratireductor sp.]|uniref:hypothetical protein n=1 Tax=uncultured Nitratireductor sp. TaxID=520953 RepID=UPI0025F6B50D|nr:hypothetical protein [uncultured Nitratireductor sp.]